MDAVATVGPPWPWSYWQGVKTRDKYHSLHDFPEVERRFFIWIIENF